MHGHVRSCAERVGMCTATARLRICQRAGYSQQFRFGRRLLEVGIAAQQHCQRARRCFNQPSTLGDGGNAVAAFVTAQRLLVLQRSEGLAATVKGRSEEHTSELQSLMRSSYAVFCLKKTKT